MRNRFRLAAVIAVALGLVAGCTSSGGHKGTSSGAGSPSVRPTDLATRLSAALDALTSAHLDIDAGTLGGKSTADVALKQGHATATQVTVTQAGQQIEVLTVGGKSYAKLPASMNSSGKPWVLVTADSTNTVVRTLSSALAVADVTTSLSVISGLVGTASDLKDAGSESVDGVAATHYTMKIDPTKKTGNGDLDSMLKLLGSSKIPVDLWVDGKNRPVKFTLTAKLGNTSLPIVVGISRFDAPLSIAAPPPSQVSTK